MKRHQRVGLMMTTIGAVIALGAMSMSIGSASASSKHDPNDGHKVTICHAVSGLGETKHGYNIITVDVASIFKENGHAKHTKDGRHDIIPAFDYYDKHDKLVHFVGLGDASWIANGCVAPEVDQPTEVTLCHATHSTEVPYELVTVILKDHGDEESLAYSVQKLSLDGHEGHDGDIIPPFSYMRHGHEMQFDGRNWDDKGKVILANDCVVPPDTMVKVCHATKSVTMPYELVEVKVAALYGADTLKIGGHELDTGALWTTTTTSGWGDIIPAFDYMKDAKTANYAGYNWSDAGKAIYAAKCVVTIETTTTPTTAAPGTTVAQQLPLPEQVADASGALPGTGSSQTMLLVIGALMALGGLIVTVAVRRPHHA